MIEDDPIEALPGVRQFWFEEQDFKRREVLTWLERHGLTVGDVGWGVVLDDVRCQIRYTDDVVVSVDPALSGGMVTSSAVRTVQLEARPIPPPM